MTGYVIRGESYFKSVK